MRFRSRLALFLVTILAVVQAVTAFAVYEATRRQLVAEGSRQLTVEAAAFAHRIDDISMQVADSVQVLSLDYALRAAVAQGDRATVRSVLRNHGRRVGAVRMMLVDLDQRITVDTAEDAGADARFPFGELYQAAIEKTAASSVAFSGRPYWMVVVPMFTPTLTAVVAALIPMDDPLLQRLQGEGMLPSEVELLVDDGGWKTASHSGGRRSSLAAEIVPRLPLPFEEPRLLPTSAGEMVVYAVNLRRPAESAPVALLLGYSLDAALRPYTPIAYVSLALLLLGLCVGFAGALVLAGGVSRPIEGLAVAARRIAGGELKAPAPLPRADEVGDLSRAISEMAHSLTEREQRIRHQSEHDAVTGLPNRRAATRRIEADLAGAAGGALLMVGIGRHAEIAKTIGHSIADALMQGAGARLGQQLAGAGVIARAGDTAFLVWLKGADAAQASAQAFRVLDVLTEPYQERDLAIDMAAAVGIAIAPRDGTSADLLVQRAEVALFGALGSPEPVRFYDAASDPHRPERLSLMSDLREALARSQLQLHYQPKLHLARGQVEAVEGLVRWQHPRRGFVAPDEFIGLAEETGNIRLLTRWALATAVPQIRHWREQGMRLDIAVNVSARDLTDATLPARVADLLALHGVEAAQLLLEITESAVMADPEASLKVLRELAGLGLRIAIDDFGIGHSSFAYLHRLPVSELKIDRSFIRTLGDKAENTTLVASMVELGHQLGYAVTAEGVEDADTLGRLKLLGCDYAQGYHVARPMTPAAFDDFVRGNRWRVRESAVSA